MRTAETIKAPETVSIIAAKQTIICSSTMESSIGVQCPNNCGKILERKLLENHISSDCPMTIIDCEFKHVGCDVRLPRKDMLEHAELAVIYHLTKQVKMLEADNKTLSVRCEMLEAQHKELVEKVGEMFDKLSKFVNYPNGDQNQDNDDQEDVVMDVTPEATRDEDYSYFSVVPSMLTDFTMTNFQFHKKSNDHWVSQPFYTHTQGYKMCLRVTANGQGSGKGTHITVAVCLMKGEFDDQLEWPFKGDITIQLLNQQEEGGHYSRTIYQAKGERSKSSLGEKYICGWGVSKFKSHNELFPKYLQNDSLRFHVATSVKSIPSTQMIETEI